MKKENSDDVVKAENSSTTELPAKGRKEKKEKKKDKKPVQADNEPLPVLVEFTYTISILLLIFVALAMIVISFLTGASLFNIVLRTSVALLVIGSLLVLIYSQVSTGLLQASRVEQEEAQNSLVEKPQETEAPGNVEIHEPVEAG